MAEEQWARFPRGKLLRPLKSSSPPAPPLPSLREVTLRDCLASCERTQCRLYEWSISSPVCHIQCRRPALCLSPGPQPTTPSVPGVLKVQFGWWEPCLFGCDSSHAGTQAEWQKGDWIIAKDTGWESRLRAGPGKDPTGQVNGCLTSIPAAKLGASCSLIGHWITTAVICDTNRNGALGTKWPHNDDFSSKTKWNNDNSKSFHNSSARWWQCAFKLRKEI